MVWEGREQGKLFRGAVLFAGPFRAGFKQTGGKEARRAGTVSAGEMSIPIKSRVSGDGGPALGSLV